MSDITLVIYYSLSGVKLLEWRHQVQKEELKRPLVGLPSGFTELCRQVRAELPQWGSGVICNHVCKWWQGQKRVVGPWPDVTFRGWEHCPQAGELLPRILKEARARVDTLAGSGLSGSFSS